MFKSTLNKSFIVLLIIFSLNAAEYIKNFAADIQINIDGSVTITENIEAYLHSGKRGLYRDLPIFYKKGLAGYNVMLDLIYILKDGKPVEFSKEKYFNGYRVKIYSPRVHLNDTYHNYEIKYKLNRILGYFDNFDELYLNITGNGWPFYIENASAKISLPTHVNISRFKSFTGYHGSNNFDSNFKVDKNIATVWTNNTLSPNQGLTIAMQWPSGTIYKPTDLDKFYWFFEDNIILILAILFIILLIIYYIISIRYLKSKNKKNIIIPYFDSSGLLPVNLGYIWYGKLKPEFMAATIVDMAVNGYLAISEINKNNYLFKKSDRKHVKNIAIYNDINDILFASGQEFSFEHKFSSIALKAMYKLNKYSLESCSNNFKTYFSYFYKALGFTILSFVLFTIFNSEVAFIYLIISIFINFIAFRYLRVRTQEGQDLYDKIAGFKMFLTFTEKERLEFFRKENRTIDEYEKFLPYAMVLGVEKNWTQQFSSYFKMLEAANQSYHPVWYRTNRPFSYFYYNSLANSLNINSVSAISSSNFTPGSTSGFGSNGFSGGGSGGGGGGSF